MKGESISSKIKNAIGGRRWNIATQEWKVCDVEMEIVPFVLLINRRKFRQEADLNVFLFVVSLISRSIGYISPRVAQTLGCLWT